MSALRRWSVRLASHAGRVMPKARSEWAVAMQSEVEHIADEGAALRWAAGCVLAGYAERVKAELFHGGLSMRYHLVSLFCLIGAYAGYVADSAGSIWFPFFNFFGVGVILECIYWARVLRARAPGNLLLDAAFSWYLLIGVTFVGTAVSSWRLATLIHAEPHTALQQMNQAQLEFAAFMLVLGGTVIALLPAFRRGATWAQWALPAFLLALFGAAAVKLGGDWNLMGAATFTAGALVLSLLPASKGPRNPQPAPG